ncbi:MAG TPA: hypothetical protein VF297_05150 [Pyrinomonadaceae bacterium]
MTNSQLKSLIATTAGILATIEAKAQVLSAVLPQSVSRWIPVVVIVGGFVVAAFNQSLSTAHVSVPVEEAKALGLVGKEGE